MLLRKLIIAAFILPSTISVPAPSNLQSLLMATVDSNIIAVTSVDNLDGLRVHEYSYRFPSNMKKNDPGGGQVTDKGVAVPSINNTDGILIDYYTPYTGNGSTADGWPARNKWISFHDMFNNSKAHMKNSCRQFNVDLNTDQEMVDIYDAIQFVAGATYVDHRFILAVILQESGGCVRAPTSNYGVPNPGLMQDHNGTASCNDGTPAQNPCPGETIMQMVQEGTGGTTWGDGLAQCLNQAGTSDVSAFYAAARIYNSGSIDESGDLGKGIATHCYASDIANRLTGWVEYPKNCTLDD